MEFPQSYNKEEYVLWHEKSFSEDENLIEEINKLRDELKIHHKNELMGLANFLTTAIGRFTSKNPHYFEKSKEKIDSPFFTTMSEISTIEDNEALKTNKEYDLVFKSSSSIINKLWRINKECKDKEKELISLKLLKENINDLVRASVVCPTLFQCKKFVDYLISVDQTFGDYNKEFHEKISKINVTPEMKMASGYFAYHGNIKLKSGLVTEIQFYSKLTETWRELSHLIYEKERIRPSNVFEFNTVQSRMISLGHLLHLAECEIESLSDQIRK